MQDSVDIWKILAGVAIFLLGTRFMEESLKQLSGRNFKLFLKKQTSRKWKAILGGAMVTGVLQSSSVVSLMVLSFAGAGVLTMQNGLAVILGANLGTTLDSWIVAVAGFKLNIELISLPLAGIAGLGYALVNKESKWSNWFRFFLGFSFLFIGLGYMKSGIETLIVHTDLRQFEHAPIIAFIGIGFLITTLIQSSSATIAITLSALNAGALSLLDATAIVLGSEVGTTVKLFLASISGVAAKRRIALGNFLFNAINISIIALFLIPVNAFITRFIGIHDNLIALVFFQSLVNIFGIILFYPLLNKFSRFLEKQFKDDEETLFIHKNDSTNLPIALFALEKESRHFLLAVVDFIKNCFEVNAEQTLSGELEKKFLERSVAGKYEYLKFLHGEIHSFFIRLQKTTTEKDDLEKLDNLVSSVRNAMYAAKSIKDAIPDTEQLRSSSNDVKFTFYKQARGSVEHFCSTVNVLLLSEQPDHFKSISALYGNVTESYTHALQGLYQENTTGYVNEEEITTLLNFNRELYTAFKSLVFSIKDHLLEKEEARYFDDLPGFIR